MSMRMTGGGGEGAGGNAGGSDVVQGWLMAAISAPVSALSWSSGVTVSTSSARLIQALTFVFAELRQIDSALLNVAQHAKCHFRSHYVVAVALCRTTTSYARKKAHNARLSSTVDCKD